jgi:DMSO/TMAO reductase YedYZ molybdopterin-dependent catalytic subunit
MERRLYGTGVVTGAVALGAGLAVAELVAGLIRDAPSPVVAVGQTVIDSAPPALKDWAISTFGTANKFVLVTGTIVILALTASAAGVMAVRGRRRDAATLAGLIGVLGVLAVVTGSSAPVGHVAPTVLGTVVTIGVLWWLPTLLSPASEPAAEPATRSRMGVDRRAFFTASAALGVGAAAVGGVGRLLQRRFAISEERAALVLPTATDTASLPADSELGVDGLTSFVTPNDSFFRIDVALTVPQLSTDEWRLRIHGMVDRELELTFDDLLRREQVERYVTISCVSNEVGGGLIGNARWQGVRLDELLAETGVHRAAEQLVSTSVDGWTCGTPVSAVTDGRDALLAFAMNGEPLPAQHGYPVRMVVPGLFGYVSATKWVTDIELTTWDAFDAYWVRRGWAERGPVKTMARIDRPRSGSSHSDGVLDIGGMAWAVHRGISAVEIRIDDGGWIECELGGVPSDDTWRQWHHRWDATPGEHVIEARAIDASGEVQPAEPRPPAPDGAQGYHRVRVTVG